MPLPSATKRWLRRLGTAGLIFFLVKGLLWLVVPWLLVWWTSSGR